MPNLALADLVLPYLLRGENLGAQHAALSALRVVAWETASDDFGIAIRGQCEFNGHASIDLDRGGLQVDAGVDEAAPAFDPARRSPVFDIRETSVDFELFVPRAGSAIVAAGAAGVSAAAFTPVRDVLDLWDTLPLDPAPSDYPSTGFTLDLILKAPSLRPPFLHPAKLNVQGLLEPDAAVSEVEIGLPRLRFRLSHGNDSGSQLAFELVQAGAAGLDDPADIGVAELVSMTPPYAFIGGASDRVVGIGFRSAVLDLSNESTPPALLSKAQVGDDWTGLYLPEVRIFIAPSGARDFTFEAGANELLIGFGEAGGLWGDFEAMLVNQGSGELKLGARFVDAGGRLWGIERSSPTEATARLPERSTLLVDVSGGRTPYTRKVRVGGGAEETGTAFLVDLAGGAQDIHITVTDGSATPLQATLVVHAQRRSSTPRLPAPGHAPLPPLVATITPPGDTPVIVIASQNDTEVVVTTQPVDPAVRWRVDGGPESGPAASFTVAVAPGQTVHVQARKPGQPATPPMDFYFYFDEPPTAVPAGESAALLAYARSGDNLSTVRAVSKSDKRRLSGHQDPMTAYKAAFDAAGPLAAVRIRGHASYEGHDTPALRQHNYLLARRRAIAVRERIHAAYAAQNFNFADLSPDKPTPTPAEIDAWVAASGWTSHAAPDDNRWWKATVVLPAQPVADDDADYAVQRPAAPPQPPTEPVPVDPQPETPAVPDWFRSARLKLRIVRSTLIAAEIEAEIDFQTASEDKLRNSGQLGGHEPPAGRTLRNGVPLGPDNPADGITKFRVLCQEDPSAGRVTTMISVGADPADKDGLAAFGWLPGEAIPPKNIGLTLLGSYLSFWPMLANAAEGGKGEVMDAVLTGAALAVPGVIALLPWFQVERVVVYGGEFLERHREAGTDTELEAHLLFDVGIDWSANLLDIVIIEPQHPLSVRYKAIGLRLNHAQTGGDEQFSLRPVFDSSRGYTIDVASGGALKIADPLGQILRVLGARLSRSNPLTFEIDIGLGVDLGVVTIDRAGLRVYLDEPRPPELTALAASVDIPGALVGSGYVKIGKVTNSEGQEVAVIGGQIDLTLRPLSLRIAAAMEVATIDENGRQATGVYIGLNVVLPVGIPLGSSGLGIFGFRGIFGMHYQRNAAIGAGSGVPALVWLEAAGGQPHLLVNPDTQIRLWEPRIDRWAFGLGMLIGTMEGGVIMNLDGTLLLELPGPRVLIMMNARIISPPPSMDGLGSSGGILAVIEVTPEHFMIGILVQWDIERLIKIVIPVEAVFPFAPHLSKWHIYLGARSDIGRPIEVDVLGIVRGTGYLMFKGDGFPAYNVHNATLPAIQGFGIGLGVAASFTWGNTDIGLYLRIGGGMDAVIGFDPFVLAGTVYVAGELRLFIVSVGADAQLTVIVSEQPGGDLALYIHGQACGHVSLLFFEIEGCVDITISGPKKSAVMPVLVDKLSLKSRSPALLAGTGVDRGIDASLGDALATTDLPALADGRLPIVPIDCVPIVALKLPAAAKPGLTVGGLGTAVTSAPGLPSSGLAERGGEKYAYVIDEIMLERIDPASGASAGPAILGSTAPVVWWTLKDATEPSPTAQLALFTWEPAPATKAVEKSERLEDTIRERWGTVCEDAAPPAELLWTFRWEPLGPSAAGWDLDGIAWPDPAGTRRNGAPDALLHVHERWRSGDVQLDMLRGVFPALVVGAQVPCWQRDPPPEPAPQQPGGVVDVGLLPGLLVPAVPKRISPRLRAKMAAGAAIASVASAPGSTAAPAGPMQALRQLQHGEPMGRAALQAAFGPASAARFEGDELQADEGRALQAAAPPKLCEVRLLEAPMLDDGQPIALGDPLRAKEVAQRLKALGLAHGPLDDVVVIDIGPFARLDLLLFVRRDLLAAGRLVVRVLDAAGQELQRVVATGADLTPPKALPARWFDAAGPWADDIAELLAWPGRSQWPALYLALDKQPEAARVEIGVLPGPDDKPVFTAAAVNDFGLRPAYHVGAIGGLRWGEVERHDWDQTQILHDRQVITQALGPASSSNALMFADALYRLTVRWHGQRQGDGAKRGSAAQPESQVFWFRTERLETPTPQLAQFAQRVPLPVRLDPWMLVTLPAEHEKHWFGEEPTQLVFNTHDVDRVFAAYGKELRVRYSASSARHPQPSLAVPHPYPITEATLVPFKAVVLSPWEEAAAEVLAGSCIPVDEDRSRHGVVNIPIALEPYTDYLLDVEIVDLGADSDARGPRVFRRHFSTGGYPRLAHFAAALLAERARSRSAPAGAMEAVRAFFAGRDPLGPEFDAQWMAQGLEPLGVPERPRIVVFWETPAVGLPQPAAVLIDATEPLWRSRPYPSKVVDDTGPVTAERWVLAETEYLRIENQSAAGVVAAVGGVIRAPGLQRALVVLAAGARGKTVKLDLVEIGFPALPFLNQTERRATLIELPLDHAPWEEL
ncbi:hypothetical protein MW290_23555 [Aquincola tertiaricarbonis]|uniref:Uncharacterized protein n=1 Tax=Aquincola tertiaricarbonis TaxID=391953 RepID=A0ABY4S7A5_AQUTE|nr:hypothetical protein [Aquincola tertiaricarbonis]URI08560.1 hypothetical protein MW290_23555 [Aquincola tertiaricarbonis]